MCLPVIVPGKDYRVRRCLYPSRAVVSSLPQPSYTENAVKYHYENVQASKFSTSFLKFIIVVRTKAAGFVILQLQSVAFKSEMSQFGTCIKTLRGWFVGGCGSSLM